MILYTSPMSISKTFQAGTLIIIGTGPKAALEITFQEIY
jgi:hypothetical protein